MNLMRLVALGLYVCKRCSKSWNEKELMGYLGPSQPLSEYRASTYKTAAEQEEEYRKHVQELELGRIKKELERIKWAEKKVLVPDPVKDAWKVEAIDDGWAVPMDFPFKVIYEGTPPPGSYDATVVEKPKPQTHVEFWNGPLNGAKWGFAHAQNVKVYKVPWPNQFAEYRLELLDNVWVMMYYGSEDCD